MQLTDRPSTECWCRDYLLSWLPLHQRVNPATDAEPQLWPVWDWHCPLLRLRSSTRVRLHWPGCHWCRWYRCLCRGSGHLAATARYVCIKRKQETIFCRGLAADDMADCIVQLPCMTGCDANSDFSGKGKKSVYDQVAKSPVALRQLSRCEESLDLEEEVVEQLFMSFTATIRIAP